MIVEQRTYDIIPGKLATFTALYECEGLAVQAGHLGMLLGYYSSEFGDLNQVVHLWGYEDLADRQARRTALFDDPAWLAYFDKVIPIVARQRSVILHPLASVRPTAARILQAMEHDR